MEAFRNQFGVAQIQVHHDNVMKLNKFRKTTTILEDHSSQLFSIALCV